MQGELKNCPRCDCDDLDLVEDDTVAKWANWYIWCRNCAVSGPRTDNQEGAKELWNARLEPENINSHPEKNEVK
jgi:hypothetical protein